MLETPMFKEFRNKLKTMPIVVEKIESGSTTIGLPDIHCRTAYHDLWIESKELKRWPKNPQITLKPDWRPGQLNWINSYKKLGGKVFLMITYHNQWFLLKIIEKEYTQKEICKWSFIPQDFKLIKDYQLLNILNDI